MRWADATTDAGAVCTVGDPAVPASCNSGRDSMTRRIWIVALLAVAWAVSLLPAQAARAEQAYGRSWGSSYSTQDWDRFYHYPYVYYPQNYWGNEYFRSADSLYYRYPPEMRIPVYNRHWFNDYPTPRPYYRGAHFVLDIF